MSEERVSVPILVCELADGTIFEGRKAQALLRDVMDFGWPGTIEDAPKFTYRTETRPLEEVERPDPPMTPREPEGERELEEIEW